MKKINNNFLLISLACLPSIFICLFYYLATNGHFFSDIGIHRHNEGVLDAIWLSPHFTWTKQYLAATYDMPLHKVFTSPYIWDSELIEKIMKSNPVFDTDQTPYFRPFDPQNKKIYTYVDDDLDSFVVNSKNNNFD